MTAFHEAGHTLVAFYTKDATPLHKVTIVPRGMSLGHVCFNQSCHLSCIDPSILSDSQQARGETFFAD